MRHYDMSWKEWDALSIAHKHFMSYISFQCVKSNIHLERRAFGYSVTRVEVQSANPRISYCTRINQFSSDSFVND